MTCLLDMTNIIAVDDISNNEIDLVKSGVAGVRQNGHSICQDSICQQFTACWYLKFLNLL